MIIRIQFGNDWTVDSLYNIAHLDKYTYTYIYVYIHIAYLLHREFNPREEGFMIQPKRLNGTEGL